MFQLCNTLAHAEEGYGMPEDMIHQAIADYQKHKHLQFTTNTKAIENQMKNQWVVGSKSQDKQRILNPKWRKVLIGD